MKKIKSEGGTFCSEWLWSMKVFFLLLDVSTKKKTKFIFLIFLTCFFGYLHLQYLDLYHLSLRIVHEQSLSDYNEQRSLT